MINYIHLCVYVQILLPLLYNHPGAYWFAIKILRLGAFVQLTGYSWYVSVYIDDPNGGSPLVLFKMTVLPCA